MLRSTSPTWSVYESAWPLADQNSSSPPVAYVDGPPDALTLKGCGLAKEALLQYGAQGAVYAAHERELGADQLVPESPRRRYAVKRLFSQTNDFGRRGVEETVLREATVLRYANSRAKQRQRQLTQRLPQHTHASEGDPSPSPLHPPPPPSAFTFGQDDSVNVIQLYRVVEAPHREMCLVMELCASDMRRLTMERPAPRGGSMLGATKRTPSNGCAYLANPSVLRYLLRRMLSVVHFLHQQCGILHRDIKLSNFLVLAGGELRLTDFGSARFLVEAGHLGADSGCRHPISGRAPATTAVAAVAPSEANDTTRVSYSPASTRTTMLYQPPETLMGSQEYGTALDVWGLGVVFAELILQKHLFTAESELALLSAIWKLLGTPTKEMDSEALKPTFDLKFSPDVVPEEGADLLRRMLTLVPEKRITLEEALSHPFLSFEGAAGDDINGARLWREKVAASLEKREEAVKVCMPTLSSGLHDDDEDDGDEHDKGDGVPRLPELAPPNFTLRLF